MTLENDFEMKRYSIVQKIQSFIFNIPSRYIILKSTTITTFMSLKNDNNKNLLIIISK